MTAAEVGDVVPAVKNVETPLSSPSDENGGPTSSNGSPLEISVTKREEFEETPPYDGSISSTVKDPSLSVDRRAERTEERTSSNYPTSTATSYISPGLSNVSLPLPMPKGNNAEGMPKDVPVETPVPVPPPPPAKVGDEVTWAFGRGKVVEERDNGMLEVHAMGWELAGEQRPRYYVRRDAVTVAEPKKLYDMSVTEKLQHAAALKVEGTVCFKAKDLSGALVKYMKAVAVIGTCKSMSDPQNARALEVLIPCHNNAATCYIRLKKFKDAIASCENVITLCASLERSRWGPVMEELRRRGVSESKSLRQWWCKGLFLRGKACLYTGDYDEAVKCLEKALDISRHKSLTKDLPDIEKHLDLAKKKLAVQNKKTQKMWNKAFAKNATEPEEAVVVAGMDLALKLPALNGLSQKDLAAAGAMKGLRGQKYGSGDEEDEDEDTLRDISGNGMSLSSWVPGLLLVGAVAAAAIGFVTLGRRKG
ncbi:unnamed protein product [Discosporangium mesarthrocarpum]